MEEIRMRRRFAIKFLSLIPVISIAAAAQSAPPRKDIPTIAKAANGAIVTIITATNDKPIAQGTGFLVSADGVIVTNYHVIETGNVAAVKFPDDTAFLVDGVLATDKVRDLAIMVRNRRLKPEKGRRKDLRKIDTLIADLQLFVGERRG